MESVTRVVKRINRASHKIKADRYKIILEDIKLSAEARCDFEEVELTIKRGKY